MNNELRIFRQGAINVELWKNLIFV
jgi:hypothetical protein